MAIAANEIKRYLSGGGSNTLPSASLGGARSSTEVSSTALFNLFDRTSSAEALAGDTEYRCYYIRNESATDTWLDVKVYIQSNTPSADTTYEVGIGTAGKNATEQTIADEETAPTGVTFSAAANEGAALDVGDLAPNDYIAIWLKRIVSATASAVTTDPVTLRFFGDHPA
jgi:hypothetical protein